MSFATVRTELASIVCDVADYLTVYSYEHPEPQLPAALVTWTVPVSFQARATADGAIHFDMTVRLIVGKSDPILAQQGLDRLLSSTLPDAIRSHETDVWTTANPSSFSPPYIALDGAAVMVDLTVEIHAKINESE